jgi:hypothetical protein
VRGRQPTAGDVDAVVAGRAAILPILLWSELGGEGDFTPLWLFEQLRRLGYGPLPAGFWWRSDIPVEQSERLAAFARDVDEAYPDDERC